MQIKAIDIRRLVAPLNHIVEIEFDHNLFGTNIAQEFLRVYVEFLVSNGFLSATPDNDDMRVIYIFTAPDSTSRCMRYCAASPQEALRMLDAMQANYNLPTKATA